MKQILLLGTLLSCFTVLFSKTLILSGEEHQVNLKNYFYHLEDTTNQLTIYNLPQKNWKKIKGVPAFSNNLHIHWLKFQLSNSSKEPLVRSIFIPYHHIHEIDIFKQDDLTRKVAHIYKSGTKRDQSKKQYTGLGYAIPIHIEAGQKTTYFFKLHHIFRPLRATSFLMSPHKQQKIAFNSERIIWFWRGVYLFGLVMSFILFWLLKIKMFLFYTLLNLGFGLFISSHIGDIFFFIDADPTDLTTLIDYLGAFLINLSFPLFINRLSPIKKRNPILWKVTFIIIACIGVLALLNFITPLRTSVFTYYSHFIIMIGSGLVFILQPIQLIKCMVAKDKNSFLLFGIYSFFVFTAFANIILPNMGVVEDSPFVYNGVLIGSLIEIFAFMFLMGKETFNVYLERSALLKEQKDHQKEIMFSIVNSQEAERNKVGRELHDLIGANMSLIKMKLNNPTKEVSKLVKDTIEQVRNMSRGLLSPEISDIEFLDEMKDLCQQFSTDKQTVQFFSHNWSTKIENNTLNQLYRICQELLNNAHKHSNAKNVFLQFTGHDTNKMTIVYEDNGVGFNYQTLKKGSGFKNIKNRVAIINANLTIDSTPKNGCTIIITL